MIIVRNQNHSQHMGKKKIIEFENVFECQSIEVRKQISELINEKDPKYQRMIIFSGLYPIEDTMIGIQDHLKTRLQLAYESKLPQT